MFSLDNIQNADRKTRVRWLVILSSLSGIFVITIWIAGIKNITSETAATQDATGTQMFSNITNTLGQGFSDFKNGIGTTINYFKEKASQPAVELTPTTTPSPNQ